MSADDYRHCEALVREADKNRFLSALFAPVARRDALFALYAFHVEIARVPLLAREPFAVAIRLQWWRDALGGERPGEAAAHPVAAALIDALSVFEVSPAPLIDYLDVKRAMTFGETAADSDAAIFLVAARLLGATDPSLTMAANHAGAAYALVVERRTPGVARDSYNAFRPQSDTLPKAAFAAFLPAALVPLLLRHPDAPQWRRQIAMLLAAWFGFPKIRR
jgi:phytoene/squalene synthetase